MAAAHAVTASNFCRDAAVSTTAANTTRFSTALAWARFARSAQADRGACLSRLLTAAANPWTIIRFKLYGSQISVVSSATNVRYRSSVDMGSSPAERKSDRSGPGAQIDAHLLAQPATTLAEGI